MNARIEETVFQILMLEDKDNQFLATYLGQLERFSPGTLKRTMLAHWYSGATADDIRRALREFQATAGIHELSRLYGLINYYIKETL